MSELRIEGQVQGTAQSQRKAQPQKKENIVIEFTSLPDNMKTAKVRAFSFFTFGDPVFFSVWLFN